MPAVCPIRNLPSWIRPFPEDATDAQLMAWWTELTDAAKRAGKPHLANFAGRNALLIAARIQQRAIAGLRAENKALETKLTEKTEVRHEEVAERFFAMVSGHTDEQIKKSFAAFELRVEQVLTTEAQALRRIGELAQRIAELERTIADAEAFPR